MRSHIWAMVNRIDISKLENEEMKYNCSSRKFLGEIRC